MLCEAWEGNLYLVVEGNAEICKMFQEGGDKNYFFRNFSDRSTHVLNTRL